MFARVKPNPLSLKHQQKKRRATEQDVGWLFGVDDISTFVDYLTPNPFLYKLSVLFKTIQFSISMQFKCKYNLIVEKHFYFKLFSLLK